MLTNRVQAIKNKFENLNCTNEESVVRKSIKATSNRSHLCKQTSVSNNIYDKENDISNYDKYDLCNEKEKGEPVLLDEDMPLEPNTSYLYCKSDLKRNINDNKKSLTRQTSDPGKKLHRSHAFRCDRSQKITHSPKRHGSCNGRSETSDFTLKMSDKKLSKDRLKKLGNLLEDQMRKENFVMPKMNETNTIVGEVNEVILPYNSVPDTEVPQHILDQYAKVLKPKKESENKQDTTTDSGVSSETENVEEEKASRVKKLKSQFEKTDNVQIETKTNLETMNDLFVSSETMRLERKNPHLLLTDTLKKALKQPLPPGPPPKKPPRTFNISSTQEKKRKDTKQMLEKLEQVLQKRESNKVNIYDVAETNEKNLSVNRPKEIHYLCTEILDITHRTLLPNQNQNVTDTITNCFNSLNCAIATNNSTMSLPYTRLSTGSVTNRSSMKLCCSCSNDSLDRDPRLRFSTFLNTKNDYLCLKCQTNREKHGFKCHLNCKCKMENFEFFLEKEHIYDLPFKGIDSENKSSHSSETNTTLLSNNYGTLNKSRYMNHSKSLEDLRIRKEEQTIYDIPCELSRPSTPQNVSTPTSHFELLRRNFEKDHPDITIPKPTIGTAKPKGVKPQPLTPKPVLKTKIKVWKSTENLSNGVFKKNNRSVFDKRRSDTSVAVNRGFRYSGPKVEVDFSKKEHHNLDVDRENLNRLMNEIYETVTAACNMDEYKSGRFPTEPSDGSTSEESVKLTRSLTEKRKNYVRRVSSRVAYLDPKNIKTTRYRHQTSICSYKSENLDNPYSTFRSWKSFRASQSNLSKDNKMEDRRDSTDSKFNLTDSYGNVLTLKDDLAVSVDSIDNLSIDEKTGCVDIQLPFEAREKGLFNVCLLVGLNYMKGNAYVKSVFPSQVQVPPHIENLIFPETLSSVSRGEWSAEARGTQCYSLVLTDERGERSYGYCRRVLPEGANVCLPLCYCVIGKYRAPGFYYKVLQEIESHHGVSEIEINSILQQLFDMDFPNPGEEIKITHVYKQDVLVKNTYRNSVNLGDILKCKTMPVLNRTEAGRSECFSERRDNFSEKRDNISEKQDDFSDRLKSTSDLDRVPDFYDLENNNTRRVTLSLDGPKITVIKRPIEPRADEDNLSVLLDSLGAGLAIKVFGSLLLERKVVIISDKLSAVSSCMEALQTSLYPFVWQQPLISAIPAEIQRDVLEAPLPILAGMLKTNNESYVSDIVFEEGMLIDLTHPSKVLHYQGDESTILPTSSYKALKTSLQMESSRHKDKREDVKTRNVMISEAFLRFFVDILGDFWKYFTEKEISDGDMGKGGVVFDKESFIKNVTSKQNQYFLEWFTETAMFNHFIQNMAVRHRARLSPRPRPQIDHNVDLVDTPLPAFYELFETRVRCRSEIDVQKVVESKSNYKSAVNRKVRLLKNKLRDLVT